MNPPVHLTGHQLSLLEHPQMLRDRRQRHGERRCQLGDHGGSFSQPREHRPTRPVRERVEDQIELVVNGSGICHGGCNIKPNG